jgi:hypothetical protein
MQNAKGRGEARPGEERQETAPKKGSVAKDAGEAIETACGVNARGFRARGTMPMALQRTPGGLK